MLLLYELRARNHVGMQGDAMKSSTRRVSVELELRVEAGVTRDVGPLNNGFSGDSARRGKNSLPRPPQRSTPARTTVKGQLPKYISTTNFPVIETMRQCDKLIFSFPLPPLSTPISMSSASS